jgi:hypothetical protein
MAGLFLAHSRCSPGMKSYTEGLYNFLKQYTRERGIHDEVVVEQLDCIEEKVRVVLYVCNSHRQCRTWEVIRDLPDPSLFPALERAVDEAADWLQFSTTISQVGHDAVRIVRAAPP